MVKLKMKDIFNFPLVKLLFEWWFKKLYKLYLKSVEKANISF